MSGYNGHHIDPMSLGLQLGEIKAETRRQTEIILSQGAQSDALQREILATLQHLPGHIASTLPSAPARASLLNSKTVIAILQALPPVLFLLALISAKAAGWLTWGEVLPLMRQAIGG